MRKQNAEAQTVADAKEHDDEAEAAAKRLLNAEVEAAAKRSLNAEAEAEAAAKRSLKAEAEAATQVLAER